jgi:hypothetical protein
MDVERERRIMNWAIFGWLVEKNIEDDNQSVELQASGTEHQNRCSSVRMA